MSSPILTGRYSIVIATRPMLVKLTRVTAPRRWTTISVASPLTPDVWIKVHYPALRDAILVELREADLETASVLYTVRTGVCGCCGRASRIYHDGCLSRKFGDTPTSALNVRSPLCQ